MVPFYKNECKAIIKVFVLCPVTYSYAFVIHGCFRYYISDPLRSKKHFLNSKVSPTFSFLSGRLQVPHIIVYLIRFEHEVKVKSNME